MARDPDITQPPVTLDSSAEIGKPNVAPPEADDPYEGVDEIDKKYWIMCLEDAERAEQEWRKRGREIIQIYRNESSASKARKSLGDTTFNILYANTEVMLPAVYQRPPKPVVRSRFVTVEPPPPPPPPPMPGMPPGIGPPGLPSSPAPSGGLPLPGMPPPEGGGMPPGGSPSPLPPMGPPGAPPPMPASTGMPPGEPLVAPPPPMAPPGVPAPPPSIMGQLPAGPMMGQLAAGPSKPLQSDIEMAASVMQRALEIVVEDDASHEAVKMALKDVLLPGRGLCRVRWKPKMEQQPVDPAPLSGAPPAPLGDEPEMEDVKVWEEVSDEYVFWEDFLCDPVRAAADTDWIAFRHLFTKEQLEEEFEGSPQYTELKQANRLSEILRWTDESAAKAPPGGGAALKSARHLGDHVKKCMLWEIWSRTKKQVIWFCRDAGGIAMRVDPDTYQLSSFYPIPVPLLAVTTTDSRIPRPYYDLYARLAADLDEVSVRISALTRQIKARGAYNSASRDIADILAAADQKMLPVDGVDMLNGGLANHVWMLPIEVYVQCLQTLIQVRDNIKQAIYEVMGISDIMRGATRATETATAQRIKGSMGMSRLEDQKQAAANFARDLLRLKGELIAQNFDASTLAQMTNEDVTASVMAILRNDFSRICAIDIESDSTVVPDLQAEQQGIAMVMQAVQMVMQGIQGMLMTGLMPPEATINMGMELLKMALHPVPYSRGVVQLVNDLQKQLTTFGLPPPPMPPGGPGAAPPPQPGVPGVGPPPGRPTIPASGVSRPNGPPPAPMLNA